MSNEREDGVQGFRADWKPETVPDEDQAQLLRSLFAPELGKTEWEDADENQNPTDVGAQIVLISTTDPRTRLDPPETGVVTGTDDLGTVQVRWDSGSALGLVPGVDRWRRLHPRWTGVQQQWFPIEGNDK